MSDLKSKSLAELHKLAGEAGISLEPFPAVRDWLARFAALPGHLGMGSPASRLSGDAHS